jgi:hypothetical protein
MHQRHLEKARQAVAAMNRRRQLALWIERYEQVQRIKPRSDEERIAKHQALELMEQARP